MSKFLSSVSIVVPLSLSACSHAVHPGAVTQQPDPLVSGIFIVPAEDGEVGTVVNGRCSICVREGQRSTVMSTGCQSTLAAVYAYYDEKGQYHYYDPNTTTCSYVCSRGHAIMVSSK